jgi:hypothetical protein
MLKAFKALLQTREAKHQKLLAKNVLAKGAWCVAFKKLKMCQHHKIAFFAQVQSMNNGNQRPTLIPSPLPFVSLDINDCGKVFKVLSISPCLFCHRGFELAWDCKIVSYKHAYHSWCVISHFSNSSKCLLKGCEEEMHLDWWVLSSIKKPCGDEKQTSRVDWTRGPHAFNNLQVHPFNNLQGEFTYFELLVDFFSQVVLHQSIFLVCNVSKITYITYIQSHSSSLRT